MILEHALVAFFQNYTSLMGLVNRMLQNVSCCSLLSSRASNTLHSSEGDGRVMERTTKEEDLQEYAKIWTSYGVVHGSVQTWCREVCPMWPYSHKLLLQTHTGKEPHNRAALSDGRKIYTLHIQLLFPWVRSTWILIHNLSILL